MMARKEGWGLFWIILDPRINLEKLSFMGDDSLRDSSHILLVS